MKNDMYINDRDPIQRWFFKPTSQNIKDRVSDAARGILRPIDNFTYGKNQPKSVSIQDDPYYQVGEAIKEQRARQALIKQEQEAAVEQADATTQEQSLNGAEKAPEQSATPPEQQSHA
jgi:hypothetical protein